MQFLFFSELKLHEIHFLSNQKRQLKRVFSFPLASAQWKLFWSFLSIITFRVLYRPLQFLTRRHIVHVTNDIRCHGGWFVVVAWYKNLLWPVYLRCPRFCHINREVWKMKTWYFSAYTAQFWDFPVICLLLLNEESIENRWIHVPYYQHATSSLYLTN